MAEPVSTTTGTPSTPPAESPSAVVADAPVPVTTAPADVSKPVVEGKAPEAIKADAVVQDGPKPIESAPLFTLPEDFKASPDAVSKFESAIKGAMVEGKLTVTPQQIADWYVDQARDANAAWQKQITDLNVSNETACKKEFTAQQLTGAETAVGWFTANVNPGFRELAKRQLNDPVFVNAMVVVGEMLSEDSFEAPGKAVPSNRPRTRAEMAKLLYPNAKSN